MPIKTKLTRCLRKLVASSAAKLMIKGKKSEIFRFLRKPRISSIIETILSQARWIAFKYFS